MEGLIKSRSLRDLIIPVTFLHWYRRESLTVARGLGAGTGNANFGYFGGGFTPIVSTVDRIDYSNDTVTATPKGPLSSTRRYPAGTGNASFGYWGGGIAPGTVKSTVDRIQYDSDTVTASPKGPLSDARYGTAATSAEECGLPQ